MKKLFLLLALLGMVATGCSKDEVDKGNDNKTEQPNENEGGNEDNIPENIFFGIDKESATIAPDGGSVDVIVYSNYKWEISGTSDWCTPSAKSGDANEDGQKVSFSADVTYDDREATFWFRCADKQIKFVVSQKLKEVIIPDANNTFNIPAEGGVAVISYQTSVDCEVIIPEEVQDWITIAPATRGLVSENINLDIAENTTYDSRSAVIKVVAKDNAELVVEYTINQVQNDAVIADENNVFTVPGPGGEVVIKYQTNVDCEIIIPDEAQDWITIATSTRGLSTYSTTLNIAENNSDKERSCVVKVTSQDDNELFAEYTITQNPRYCLYYTSSDGKIVQPNNNSAFGATIISNTYIDGIGVIDFNTPITTIGDYAFRGCSSLTSVTIPDSVTEIGYEAFALCSNLQEFKSKFASEDGRCLIIDGTLNSFAPGGLVEYTIPNSVTTIGGYAFYGCSSLTSVTIPDSVTEIGGYAFNDCSSLTSVTIGDSVTTIGEGAFYDCDSLTSVTIPDSATSIGYAAFAYCSSLISVTIPDSVTTIGDYAFWGCTGELIINSKIVETDYTYDNNPSYYGWLSGAEFTKLTIGDSVTAIGNSAFEVCTSLTSVTIGDSVTTIGEYAFRGCSSLTSVYISDIAAWCNISFSSWESNPLNYAHNLYLNNELVTDLIIPDSVTKIGSYAFQYCANLTSVTIPDSVTTIGDDVFWGCDSLTSVYISDIAAWCNISFGSSYSPPLYYAGNLYLNNKLVTDLVIPNDITEIKSSTFSGFNSLTSVTIGNNVTTIGESAFYYCESLTSVTISDSVTTIGDAAFRDCSSLTSVTIPDSVTTIGNSTFNKCKSLTSVTIPDSVTTIGNNAFYLCDSLTSVYCKATTPPAGGSNMFSSNASGRKIYVPMESVEAYKSAQGWRDYASDIVGYNF